MRRLQVLIPLILILSIPLTVSAFRLPECTISPDERDAPAEETLSNYKASLDDLGRSVSLVRIEKHRRDPKLRLTAKERRAIKEYDALTAGTAFWKQIKELKDSLIALHGANPQASVVAQADSIAKIIIETLYDLSQKWKIGSSALFNNFLINMGAKEKGYCYQYVAQLRRALTARSWSDFDIRWGTAWEETFRENNALVITAKGAPFETGLVVDAWRTAGRPFWTAVKGDRFPWVEALNVEARFNVE